MLPSSRMPTLTVEGLRIHVHEWSPAPDTPRKSAVVCIPSTGMSGIQWRRLGKLLSDKGHRVVAPDLIGYGESDSWPGPGPFETRFDVAVAGAVIDMLEDHVHLVGHSYGGRVGLAEAVRRPDRIRAIALFEPTCFGVLRSTGEDAAIRELLEYDADGRFLDDTFGGSEPWIQRFVDYWSGQGAWAELSDAERATWVRAGRKMFEEVRETALDQVPHTVYVEALGHLPMLVMSGAESTLAGRGCCAVLGRVMPRGRHVELADVGHMGPLLAAREVNGLIAEHIAGIEG